MAKFYITTSIAYVNAPPHIGFAQEVVAVDVLARAHRQLGDDTFFLTGTDEHGTKIERAAKEAGKEPQAFANEIAKHFENLKTFLNLSNDDFVRTSQVRHKKVAQSFWQKAFASGDIYKKQYKAFYCVGHEAFITEKELVNGVCPDHKTAPEQVEEENYFFKVSKYAKDIESRIRNNELRIIPESRKNEVLSFLKQGVHDVSVSRPKEKLAWGIPVPNDPDHVMYVWFDALTNYLNPDPEKWWPAEVHVIGKDILRFHAVIWPAMLLSAGLPLPKNILVHGFIIVDGQKMSKSLGNVIEPKDLVDKFGLEATRFLLVRELPFLADGDFSWEKATARYNAELANDLGNLVQRTVTLMHNSKFIIHNSQSIRCAEADQAYQNLDISAALEAVWDIVKDANQYIDQTKPWALSGEALNDVLKSLANRLLTISAGLAPVLPETAKSIQEQLKSLNPKPLFLKLK